MTLLLNDTIFKILIISMKSPSLFSVHFIAKSARAEDHIEI